MRRENFEAFLEKKGLKYTRERKAIVQKISELEHHFDADGLYEILKKEKIGIARGTVYRTLPLLVEGGVIQTSVGKGKGGFFERAGSHSHHDHILCVSCGRIIEYHCHEIEELQDKICQKYDVELLFHEHKLFVRCAKCRK